MSSVKILLLFILGTCSVASIAQKFSYGLKAGILGVYTNFPEQDSLRSGIKPGFNVGGLIIFPLKKEYSFTAEGGFSQQGRSWTYKPNDSKWTSTYHFIDLSMALRKSFQLKLFKDVPSTWFVNIGPNINYWLTGKGRFVPGHGSGFPSGSTQDLKVVFDQTPSTAYHTLYINNENRWLFGLNIGFGFNMTTTRYQKFVTELRMTWGQTYLGQKNSESLYNLSANGNMSLKCNLKVINLSVGYILDRDIRRGKMGKSTKKVK
jgi:hypothetical protein